METDLTFIYGMLSGILFVVFFFGAVWKPINRRSGRDRRKRG